MMSLISKQDVFTPCCMMVSSRLCQILISVRWFVNLLDRQGNILDLFLTTNHTLVNSVNIITGLSDQNLVKCVVDTKPASTKKAEIFIKTTCKNISTA